MSVRDLIPWGRSPSPSPTPYRKPDHPFLSLHREVNRLFDDVFRGFDMPVGLGAFGGPDTVWPTMEVSETDKDITITAEVPGLDEKDIEVLLDGGVLTLRGEKRSETEDKDRHFTERYYGRFERRVAVGPDVEQDNARASFKNGVLVIRLPKTERAQSKTRRIAINSAH